MASYAKRFSEWAIKTANIPSNEIYYINCEHIFSASKMKTIIPIGL